MNQRQIEAFKIIVATGFDFFQGAGRSKGDIGQPELATIIRDGRMV